ncbi:MAG: hypothetical protein Fur0037_14740 [Planctomycetota bacterium]
MQTRILLSTLALTSLALAQNPPCVPPGQTTILFETQGVNYYTLFGANTAQDPGLAGNDGYVMDVDVNASVSLDGFSFRLFNDGDNAPSTGPWTNLGTTTTYLPALGPTPVTLRVWEIPGTWVGNETSIPATHPTATVPGTGAWNLLGTYTGSYTGPWYTQTQITWAGPGPAPTLTAGQHGLLFEFVAVAGVSCTQYNGTVTPFTPWGPMVRPSATPPSHGDIFMTVSNLGWQRNSFLDTAQVSLGTGNFVDIAMEVTYTPPAGASFMTEYGSGCLFQPRSFMEIFDGSAVPQFDLSNYTISMIPVGTQYAVSVTPGAPAWFTPVSTSLTAGAYQSSTSGSWDDAMSNPITLPATFNYPGTVNTSTNTIEINSNGLVCLQHDPSTTAGFGYYGGTTTWLNKPENFAVAYGDMDATVNGTSPPGSPYGIYYDVDPGNPNVVYVTWITQEWSPAIGPTQNVQLMMDCGTGMVEYRYQNVNMNAVGPAPILVGWTPGNGEVQPNPMDISMTPAFLTGDGSPATHVGLDARPKLGTTVNAVTSNINPASVLGLFALGLGNNPNGLPLDLLGAPTCFAYVNIVSTSMLFLTPTTAPVSKPIAIPNSPSLAGLVLASQSVLVTPGVNALGAVTSNGLCISIGAL